MSNNFFREIFKDAVTFVRPDLDAYDDAARSRKMVFSLGTFLSLGALTWTVVMVFLGIYVAALITGAYVLLTVLNLAVFYKYNPVWSRWIQVSISLAAPFLLQALLGGFNASGTLMLWATISFLAIIGSNDRWIIWFWLVIFLILFFIMVMFDGEFVLHKPEALTDRVSRLLLISNILFIGLITFLIAARRMNLDRYLIQQLQRSNTEMGDYQQELEEKIMARTQDLEASISLLKETKNEMKRALIRAQEATESKSYYLTNVSHEIRTPLNAILGYAQIMAMKAAENQIPKEYVNFLNGIQVSGNHLLDLVNNVLDISRIDSGKLQLSMETVNLHQLIKKIYEVNSIKAGQQGLHFGYGLEPSVPQYVETDAAKLNQILMNLCANAIRFSGEGKKVHLGVKLDGRYLVFRVEDEGIGIAPENHDLIFQPFTQANNEVLKKYGGTGLGLAITRRLVDLFNGKIMLDSSLGKGSVFTVYLPLIHAISGGTSAPTDSLLPQTRFAGGQKVLIVEDNHINMQVLEGFLKEIGLEVYCAYNGKEGVNEAVRVRPNVIFMDIHMPEMDGIEAVRILVSMDDLRSVPVICLTADVFGEQRKNYLSMGFSDFLTKPVEFRRISEVLEKYLLTV